VWRDVLASGVDATAGQVMSPHVEVQTTASVEPP